MLPSRFIVASFASLFLCCMVATPCNGNLVGGPRNIGWLPWENRESEVGVASPAPSPRGNGGGGGGAGAGGGGRIIRREGRGKPRPLRKKTKSPSPSSPAPAPAPAPSPAMPAAAAPDIRAQRAAIRAMNRQAAGLAAPAAPVPAGPLPPSQMPNLAYQVPYDIRLGNAPAVPVLEVWALGLGLCPSSPHWFSDMAHVPFMRWLSDLNIPPEVQELRVLVFALQFAGANRWMDDLRVALNGYVAARIAAGMANLRFSFTWYEDGRVGLPLGAAQPDAVSAPVLAQFQTTGLFATPPRTSWANALAILNGAPAPVPQTNGHIPGAVRRFNLRMCQDPNLPTDHSNLVQSMLQHTTAVLNHGGYFAMFNEWIYRGGPSMVATLDVDAYTSRMYPSGPVPAALSASESAIAFAPGEVVPGSEQARLRAHATRRQKVIAEHEPPPLPSRYDQPGLALMGAHFEGGGQNGGDSNGYLAHILLSLHNRFPGQVEYYVGQLTAPGGSPCARFGAKVVRYYLGADAPPTVYCTQQLDELHGQMFPDRPAVAVVAPPPQHPPRARPPAATPISNLPDDDQTKARDRQRLNKTQRKKAARQRSSNIEDDHQESKTKRMIARENKAKAKAASKQRKAERKNKGGL